MRVRELLRGRMVITIDADELLEEAAQRMLAHGIRHLPVTENGAVVGVLSERDLLAFRGYGGMSAPVSMAMSRPARVAFPEDDVDVLSQRLIDERLGCLPIVEGERVVGIVTRTDLLSANVRVRTGQDGLRPLSGSVGDAMTPAPVSARYDDYLLDAVGRMAQMNIRHLPVIDGDERVVGMLSDRDVRAVVGDLLLPRGERDLSVRVRTQRVGDVASDHAITVSADAPLADAVRRFVDHRIGALAAVDEAGRLVGILSYVDVLRRISEVLVEPVPPRFDVGVSDERRH